MRLGEGFVDGLFEGDNDLVVDTASMSAIGPPSGGYVKDSLALGTNDEVYHTNYFSQLRVIEAIAGWLPLGMGAGGGPEAALEAPPETGGDEGAEAELDGGVDREVTGGGDVGLTEVELEAPSRAPGRPPRLTASRPSRAQPPLPPVPLPTTERPPRKAPTTKGTAKKGTAKKGATKRGATKRAAAPGVPATSPGQLAAEMPATVRPEEDFTVRVRLGTGTIEASHGAVSVSAGVQVDAARPVRIQVVGKQNARIIGEDARALGLPQGDWTSDAQFTAQALEAGPVRITVIARQGWVPVANLTLEGEAAPTERSGLLPLTGTSRATAKGAFDIDAAGLERLPVLEIFERRVAGGRVVYQYAVRATPRGKVRHFESPPLTRSEQFAAKRIGQIADIWRTRNRTPEERFSDVQDIGVDFFERLFPEEMQEFLWERRDKLGNLLVLTDEPYMPWEIVHLKPPRGEREQEPRFLAQGGLVRWHFDRVPPQRLRVRPGRARSLCPVYEDPAFTLAGPEQEAHFLEERFGATPIRPTPRAVRDLLRRGGFDLLHFAGHGAADARAIEDARILLAAGRRDGEELQEYLSATNVSANAAWTRKGEVGPVVVLNACEVGQVGTQLSTVGGFAKAFLDAGASAFVSCLWSVRDEPSRIFVEALYDELLKGATVAAASAHARAVARDAGDETWLAYVVYARPDAVLVTEPDLPAPTTSTTPGPARPGSLTTHQPSGTERGRAMTSRALCVGINEFKTLPQSSWLNGCVNDAEDIAATLKKNGFQSRNVTVLRDAEATKEAIMNALTGMIRKSKPGDEVLFSYSSHGTQVPDLPGTEAPGDKEPDGLDEAFACYEIAVGGDGWDRDTVIVDDELRELFSSAPDGVLVEVLLDTCHSGSGTRDLDDIQRDLLRGRRPRYLPPPTAKALAQARTIRANHPEAVERKALLSLVKSRGPKAKPVLFAACRADQTASDAQFGGRPNGAFTYLFLKALTENPTGTRTDLHKAVTNGLKTEDFEQRSTLEGPVKAKKTGFGQLW